MTEESGSLSLEKRLERIEATTDKILDKLILLASAEDVRELRRRIEVLERTTVSKSVVKWLVVQAIVMISEGLGLVYMLIPRHY